MPGPNVKVTRNGETLTQRVWDLLADVSREVGCPVEVAQGGFKAGSGAGASAGTHDGGDVVDVRVANVPDHLRIPLVVALRKRNGCAWLRAPEYGWTSTGPHIHCVFRDSFYPLSDGAKQQVSSYDRGRNGLANDGVDPFPRPTQHHWTEPLPPVKPKSYKQVRVSGTQVLELAEVIRQSGMSRLRFLRLNPHFILHPTRVRPGYVVWADVSCTGIYAGKTAAK